MWIYKIDILETWNFKNKEVIDFSTEKDSKNLES